MRQLTAETLTKIMVRNLFFILPFFIIGIFIGNYISSTITPLFRSSAQIFVSTPTSSIDIGGLALGSTFSQERVKSYIQIINAPDTLKPVIQKLQLNTTPEALATRISASAPAETVVIQIYVVDENPVRASAIANEVAKQFIQTAESLELPQTDLTSPVKVSVVEPAVPDYSAISPKKNTNRLLGGTSMLILAYLFFVIKFALDSTIKNFSDLEGNILLAAIGFDSNADKKPLINEIGPYEVRTESYRTLRTNLLNETKGVKPVSIGIVSSVSEEGKTSAAINIAISCANQGMNVLIIEGDLRRPRLQQYLNVKEDSRNSEHTGLTNLLNLESIFKLRKNLPLLIENAFEGVDYIPAGKIAENPSELLAGPRFSQILHEAKRRYELILVDCPPVLPVADAAIICKNVDGAVIIVHGGKTKRKSYIATVDAIKSVNPKIYGVVINKIPNNREAEDYGYISGYSRYYRNSYSYFVKRRGYTPYIPYGPRDNQKLRKNASGSTKDNPASKYPLIKACLNHLLGVKIKKDSKNAFGSPSTDSSFTSDDTAMLKWLEEVSKNATGTKTQPAKRATRKKFK